MKTRVTIFSFIVLFFQNCVYDFSPTSSGYENLLVVYGLVSNQCKPVVVKLSRTVDINSKTVSYEDNAQVVIIDGSGKTTTFTALGYGVYSTIDNFEGCIGEKYKLIIETEDGNHYESDYETLEQETLEVSSLSYEFVTQETTDINNPLLGCQFYIDINAENHNQSRFRFELDETWEILMPYSATHYWDGSEFTEVSLPRMCWKSNIVDEFYIVNTDDYGSNNIHKYPLNFVSNETDRLRHKYCLNVKQYTMSEKIYAFWKSQYDNIGQNSLYSKQPYQINGNIKNVNDPDEIVLGLFEVSSLSNKRIFVSDASLGTHSALDVCEVYNEPTELQLLYGYYLYSDYTITYVLSDISCADCTQSGASTQRPDFWED